MRAFRLQRSLLIAGASAILSGYAAPQDQGTSPRPSFEVASIKLSKSASPLVRFQPLPGGRLVAEDVPLSYLIMTAYDLPPSRISGGPGFGGNVERYDIQAKAPAGSDSNGEDTSDIFNPGQLMRARLQSLLETRFRLKYHWATEQRRVYALTVNQGGPGIKHTQEGSCVSGLPDPSLEPVSKRGEKPDLCGFHGIAHEGMNLKLEMKGVRLDEFAAILATTELRTVIDQTGLAGVFDISLQWARCPALGMAAPAEPDSLAAELAECGGPSIFSAVKEQLGLKLEPATGPVRVMVIDHVERPSGN